MALLNNQHLLNAHKANDFNICGMCRYVTSGEMKTEYPVIIGGNNFGCGSSREHAPVALGAAGARVVIAQSYARIFFRNCVATYGLLLPLTFALQGLYDGSQVLCAMVLTIVLSVACRGELYPCETDTRLADVLETGPMALSQAVNFQSVACAS